MNIQAWKCSTSTESLPHISMYYTLIYIYICIYIYVYIYIGMSHFCIEQYRTCLAQQLRQLTLRYNVIEIHGAKCFYGTEENHYKSKQIMHCWNYGLWNNNDCGWWMEIGQSWLILTHPETLRTEVNSCSLPLNCLNCAGISDAPWMPYASEVWQQTDLSNVFTRIVTAQIGQTQKWTQENSI